MNKLAELPDGSKIFVDSNILTYHLLKDPIHGAVCRQFIERAESGEITGFISPVIVSETLYNFIKAYVVKKYGVKPKDVILLLKTNPEMVRDVNIDSASELFGIFKMLPVSDVEVMETYSAIKSYATTFNVAV